jgi:hypothetical protein
MIQERELFELDDGAVGRVRLPICRDDLVGDERPAGLVGDAQREGPPQRPPGVHAPDGAPRLVHGDPHPRRLAVVQPRLHHVHLHNVAVAVGILYQHGQVVGVGPMLHVEGHRQPRVEARNPAHIIVITHW